MLLLMDIMDKKKRFNEIVKKIKEVKIQGATNIARKALYAYNLVHTSAAKKKLLSARPTEPMLMNVLKRMDKEPYDQLVDHFSQAQEKINKVVSKLIKNGDVIFTHCHSSNVIKALVYAKKKGKKFEVYATETRPLFQGRKTVRELRKANVKTTLFVDSAAGIAMTKSQDSKKATKVFFGADALLKNGVINKVGSGMFAQIAKQNKIPVYIIADSWKLSPKKVKLEERDFHEVWENLPKNSHIKIRNPAFELVPKKVITKIISEHGLLSYNDFLRKGR